MEKSIAELNIITEKIIGCGYKVSNTLGIGFLEKVYENALTYELTKSGLAVKQQHPIQVKYEGILVGDYTADILVEDCVIIELKTVKQLDDSHLAQCMNYLKATGLHVCLLLNFASSHLLVKRIVHNFPEP
jgi:GxxExxY protein